MPKLKPKPTAVRRDPAAVLHRRHRRLGTPLLGWNAVLATMLAHHSIRHFRPDPLPSGTVELLVTAAQSASTSSNLQLWSVVAVEDSARRARLAHLAGQQGFIAKAPLLLVWLADLHRIETLAAGMAVEGTQYLEAFIIALTDAALAAQNALLAAESLGLGGVYIGAIRDAPEQVARELALPPRVFALFGLALGWPDRTDSGDVTPRLPLDVVLHREQYRAVPDAAAIAGYDDTLRDFQREQELRPSDWTTHCVGRLKDAAALRGRARLREALETLGFPLR